MKRRSIGIFAGSFNPIHVGHLILANYMKEFTYLDEVWFVVTPQNPLKDPAGLLDDKVRLEMVRIAVKDLEGIGVSDIEFRLPRPSYTVDTLAALEKENPEDEFSLIMGADNWHLFTRWKAYDSILQKHKILIYPRGGKQVIIPTELEKSVTVVNAPLVEISSTFIRESIANGKNMQAFLPHGLPQFIKTHKLYQ